MMYKLRQMMSRHTRDERGFTLVELMMVMVVIGVLTGLGFSGYNALQKRTARTQADVYWRDLNAAVQMYRLEEGKYPEADPSDTPPKTLVNVLDGIYLDGAAKPWKEDAKAMEQDPTDQDKYSWPSGAGVGYHVDGDLVCVWVVVGETPIESGNNPEGCPTPE